MADVTIEANCELNLLAIARRAGIFWTSPTVGYVFYVDFDRDLKYQKTSNGGGTWGGAVNIRTGAVQSFDCWADWQTAGDAGTKIHIVYHDSDSDDVRYVYLDTDGDSVGGDVQIEAAQGDGTFTTIDSLSRHYISITKTRGGNLAVAFRYRDNSTAFFYAFYTSPDGSTWNNKASPWEADPSDFILLFPANLADNQDLWAAYWDSDTSEISLKTFDDSAGNWTAIGEAVISGSMALTFTVTPQWDGQIRLSDGHLIFAAWSQFDNAASDLMVWDITDAGTITAKTNVITDEAENCLASVFINQINNDIYIAYVQGTAAESLVKCVFKKSTNGGGAWGDETTMQVDAEDDMRWVSAGAMKPTEGKFQPIWFDIDDFDLFTNSDNGVSLTRKAKRGWAQK